MSPPAPSLSQDSTSEKVASKRQPLFGAGTFFKFGSSRHSRGPSGSLATPSTDGRSPEESGSEVVPLDSAESQPSSSSIPNTGQEQVNGKEARGRATTVAWKQPEKPGSTEISKLSTLPTPNRRSHPYKKPTVKDDGKQEDNGKQEDDSNQKADGTTPSKLPRKPGLTRRLLQALQSTEH